VVGVWKEGGGYFLLSWAVCRAMQSVAPNSQLPIYEEIKMVQAAPGQMGTQQGRAARAEQSREFGLSGRIVCGWPA
jgi:hypothetical protein